MVQANRQSWFTYRIKFGFLIGEFKLKYYFWGFTKIYKNLLIVSLMSMNSENITTKLVLLNFVLLLYMTLVNLHRPYKMKYFNRKDYISMIVLLVLISLNLLYHHCDD